MPPPPSSNHDLPSQPQPAGAPGRGLEHPGVIDRLAHDPKRDEAVLTIAASLPWDGSDRQLFLLQEKLNAYLSFALDGEMAEEFPELAAKPLRIEIDSIHYPDPAAVALLDQVRQQIGLQGITLEVRVRAGAPPGITLPQ